MDSVPENLAAKASLILALTLLSGCSIHEVDRSAPDLESISNATYSGIADQPMTLTMGRWAGEPFVPGGATRETAGLVADFYVIGDIDGDGRAEAIVSLWKNPGGTGTYHYLAVVAWRDGQVDNTGTALIGDRIEILDGVVADGRISLTVLQLGPDDAACCPSQRVTRAWSMTRHGLQETTGP